MTLLEAISPTARELLAGNPGCANACVQPVANVPIYLAERQPVPNWEMENGLMITLPAAVQVETKKLCRMVKYTLGLVEENFSVEHACRETLAVFNLPSALKTYRALYDKWASKQDWTILVNRSKAPASWKSGDIGLPREFLEFVAARFCQFRRDDAKKQALLSIKRQWKTGRNDHGIAEPIPGYVGSGLCPDWEERDTENFPVGWDYSNILRQIKKFNLFSRALRALAHEGTAAAKKHLPQTHATRASLRFMELIEFDDVKTDFRVVDTQTGQPNDLWLLIARDKATTLLLGFGMRPARVRDDGSQEHLKLRDTKQLLGWILETYGLPPYKMTCKFEHGTATVSDGTARAITELLTPDRIAISYSSMLGGKSPVGYDERRIGNSRGKGTLESLNRVGHTMLSNMPGQTGPLYTRRPADLAAREKETIETWQLAQFLPEHLRGQAQYSLLTIQQAREHLFRIFSIQNQRRDHAIEGFERIAEWFDGQKWQPAATAPNDPNIRVRSQLESPVERCARLCAGVRFTPVSPEIITSFYQHTQRAVTVQDNGEIEFTVEGKKLYFRAPHLSPGLAPHALPPGMKCLGYFHPDDPRLLHLTDGKGAILGTWIRRALSDNASAVAESIRYNTAAFNAVKDRAENLLAGERADLESMRASNAGTMRTNDFVDVTPAISSDRANAILSPVATGLAAVAHSKQKKQTASKDRASAEQLAREAMTNLAQ